jgi:DNA transformation protein
MPGPKQRPQIIDLLCDVLATLGPVEARSMFGGWGLYQDGVMFALISGEEAYFRADDETRQDYEALGLSRFKPRANKPMTMPYYPLPPELFDDPDMMVDWGERALAAARRAKSTKTSKKRKPSGA